MATMTYQVQVNPSGSWTTVTASDILEEVSVQEGLGGSADAPLRFGDQSKARASLKIKRSALPSPWRNCPIRITLMRDGSSATDYAFVGLIRSYQGDENELTLTCEGFGGVISKTRDYSPLIIRRALFTKTALAITDDPTDAAYAGGIGNWLLWQAGGRPLEWSGTYTNPTFYYSCDQALLASPYSWVSAEDAWQELQELAQVSGGQIFQDRKGVIRYKSILSLAGASSVGAYSASDYGNITVQVSANPVVTGAICPYQPRLPRPMQDVVKDDLTRLIVRGEPLTLEYEPDWPLLAVQTGATTNQLPADAFQICYPSGVLATLGTDFSHTLDVDAQHITVVITNGAVGQDLHFYKLIIRGQPVLAGAQGSITVGSGTTKQTLTQSPLIQEEAHARRLAQLYLQIASIERPVYTLSDILYHPTPSAGDVVTVTNVTMGLSDTRCVIIDRQSPDGGLTMNLQVVPIDDLPGTNDYFITSTSSQVATKYIAY